MEGTPCIGSVLSKKTVNSVCFNLLYPILYGTGLWELPHAEDGHLYICDRELFSLKLLKLIDWTQVTCMGLASPFLYIAESHYKCVWELEKTTLGVMIDPCHHPACNSWLIIPGNYVQVFELLLNNSEDLNLQKVKVLNLLGHKTPFVEMLVDDFIVTECSMLTGNTHVGTPLVPIMDLNINNISKEVPFPVCEVRITNGLSFPGCACFLEDVHFSTHSENTRIDEAPTSSLIENYDSLEIHESPLKLECDDSCDEVLGISEQVQPSNTVICKSNKTCEGGTCHRPQQKGTSVKPNGMCTCVGPQLLHCPACPELVKGGDDRVQRLIYHVRKCHKRRVKFIIKKINDMYPMKVCPRIPVNHFLGRTVKLADQCSLFYL